MKKKFKVYDTLQNLMSGLNTSRDKQYYSEFKRRILSKDYLGILYRHWIFAKAVDIPVDDSLSKGRTVQSVDGVELEEFYQAEQDLHVQQKFGDAWRWARLYGGAGILLDVVDPATSIEEPLNVETLQKDCIKNLIVLDRNDITPLHQINEQGVLMREPIFYQLNNGTRVHPSRFIRFDGVKLPWYELERNEYWGASIVERIYDEGLAAKTASASISSMIFEANIDIVTIKDLFSMIKSGTGRDTLIERFQLANIMKSINKVTLLDKDYEEFKREPLNFQGLSPLVQDFLSIASAAADIPITRFLNQSAAGLNSTGEGDLRNYYDMLMARQETDLAPQMRQLDEVLVRHVYGYMPDEWSFTFNPLWTASAMDNAATEKTNSETDEKLYDLGAVQRHHIAARLLETGMYPTLDQKHVDALREIEELEAQLAQEAETEDLTSGDPTDDDTELLQGDPSDDSSRDDETDQQ